MIRLKPRHLSHSTVVSALLLGGLLQTVAPVLANGTAAGTAINNAATATYEDPSAPGVPINATSNTVVVTVAEIAGLTNTPLAVTDVNGGTVLPNDVINFDYLITNTGNDPTRIFIPSSANLTGPGAAGTVQILGYRDTAGTTFLFGVGGVPGAPINVTTGNTTDALGVTIGANPVGSIPAGFSLIVRVPVTVNTLASSGATISVVLGNTGANDNTPGTQNQPVGTAPTGNDVSTQDNPNGTTGESAGAPSNGEREASARQVIIVGAQPQAFAAVLKTRTAYTNNGTPNVLQDDQITYGLTLRVNGTAPTGSTGLVPADLVATNINLNGVSTTPAILVSDAIPANTVLNALPTAPPGWTVVYTTTPTSTNANAAAWTTTAPAFPAPTITRVGFINNGPIAAGTTVTGFTFTLITSGIPVANPPTTIANIAQIFGQTSGGGTTLVYDESGDQNPSNVNDNGSPGPSTPTNGVANPAVNNVDNNNDNTGTGPGGEDNVFTLAVSGTILNGPSGQPAAVGPTDNNDDFTNRSTVIPPGSTPGSTINPAPVTFTNTFSNPSTTDLLNVLLVPDDGAATATLPTNTTVVLTFGGQTATYTYNGTDFVFTSGTAIVVPTLAAGVALSYTVTVDLPAGTALSTDTGNGYPVPLFAFVDSNGNSRPDAADTTQNRTIDRLYTGFLRLVKESRLIQGTGPAIPAGQDVFSSTAKTPGTGNVIEYRITYSNISTPPAGAGNVILNATNVVITEDGTGTTAGQAANNWARDNDGNGVIDTSNVVGSAVDSGTGATITYFSGATGTTAAIDQAGSTQATDVTKYINTISVQINPGVSRSFTFRRLIN